MGPGCGRNRPARLKPHLPGYQAGFEAGLSLQLGDDLVRVQRIGSREPVPLPHGLEVPGRQAGDAAEPVFPGRGQAAREILSAERDLAFSQGVDIHQKDRQPTQIGYATVCCGGKREGVI